MELSKVKKVLLIEPSGDFIRLDRCMQSINSWGGVYRFPLNLARIGAHLLRLGHSVRFIDLQADKSADLRRSVLEFGPDLCIVSSGFPSMRVDSQTARYVKTLRPSTHVSTFGVAPTLLKERFLEPDTWNFECVFDSIVVGGEPAAGYGRMLEGDLNSTPTVVNGVMEAAKWIRTQDARYLFEHSLYRSPFTDAIATYVEGTYGCPFRCSFCVVPELYEGRFSKRTPTQIVKEFQFVIERNDVAQITLWDEGTTFQRTFINELCDGLIDLRRSNNPKFRNFTWTTRSTTALLDEEVVEKMALSGLSGITLGLESFDEGILHSIEKTISLESNVTALRLLARFGVVSIGHIILGHLDDTRESIEHTISSAVTSPLNFAQFYCAVPYPGTKLNALAQEHGLIRVTDLTKYELSNAIMDTLGGVSHLEVAAYRERARHMFWTAERWDKLNAMLKRKTGINEARRRLFLSWSGAQPLVAAPARGGRRERVAEAPLLPVG